MAAHDVAEKKSFKDTLNLPRTDFPIRPDAKVDDPAMIERWTREDLFKKSYQHNTGKEKFILHDGPPYTNGPIHLGHAYNKILKDIVTKSQRMTGKHVPVKPGWDCHGLPIEKKVSDEHPDLDAIALKKACRAYAQKWLDVQRIEFKQLGVLMNWDEPYATMFYDYEAATLRAFGKFVADGYIERKNKTVPWCFSCKTVLASAEIEYEDRKDPSIYVLFPLDPNAVSTLFPELADKLVNFLVWTTTPWTLPLNRAVLLRPSTEYVIISIKDTHIIVAKALAEKIGALVGAEYTVVAEFNSDQLFAANAKALHPFIENFKVPVLGDASVEVAEGTACVHSAPGCGPIDYEVGVRNGLEIFSPISIDGKYTVGIEPHELEGMLVTDGQIWVIKTLAANNRLFYKSSIKHSYPHCWRCHNGLIFRATRQWFCDLAKGDLKNRVLAAIENVTTIPEKSVNRLRATVEGRLEWCLSRQRVWGVPIPALMCTKCDFTYITQGFVDKIADGVAKEGIEFWDAADAQELTPKGFSCPLCMTTTFRKETDILDVWFDSGISHFAVLLNDPELQFPADMYLEGSDQHRGWFQSSLLTGLVLEQAAPMKIIFTHGYVVDGQGRKMSKSLGNGLEPQDIIKQYGTDGLRLWASSLDSSGDAVVSEVLLKNVAQVFGKIRNTCRFLLSNLYDFDYERDAIALEKLTPLDQYALQQLYEKNETVIRHYQAFDFTAIFHELGDYCTVDLSAFYLDIIKDRLYVERADGLKRRSAQTACWHILDTLTKLMAPILSFTAEQISDLYQKDKQQSIHLQDFASLDNVFALLEQQASGYTVAQISAERKSVAWYEYPSDVMQQFGVNQHAQWALLKEIRSAVLKAIEGMREKGEVKLPLETQVALHLDDAVRAALAAFFAQLTAAGYEQSQFFKEFLIVSQCAVVQETAGLEASGVKGVLLKVERAHGTKCPRCWQWEVTTDPDGLDARCQEIVGK